MGSGEDQEAEVLVHLSGVKLHLERVGVGERLLHDPAPLFGHPRDLGALLEDHEGVGAKQRALDLGHGETVAVFDREPPLEDGEATAQAAQRPAFSILYVKV